jgi:hypothetical protein
MKLKNVVSLALCSLVLGVGFIACDDDDPAPKPAPAVAGTWKYNTVKAVVEAADSATRARVIEYIEKLPNDGAETYVFNADNTYAIKYVGAAADSTGKYNFSDNKIVLDKGLSLAVSNDTISEVKDVKAIVVDSLKLEESAVTKADALRLYQRITK